MYHRIDNSWRKSISDSKGRRNEANWLY